MACEYFLISFFYTYYITCRSQILLTANAILGGNLLGNLEAKSLDHQISQNNAPKIVLQQKSYEVDKNKLSTGS